MTRINSLLPEIRVHTWGGFGSQLFTAHLILRLKYRFPGRNIKVIIHTSGVTRRSGEFDFKRLGVRQVEIDDFSAHKRRTINSPSSIFSIRRIKRNLLVSLRYLLLRFHFLETANNEIAFRKIRFWTISLRGHYTKVILDRHSINELFEVLFDGAKTYILQQQDIVVHYRLGDLLTLDDKSPISSDRVDGILVATRVTPSSVLVLTDSRTNEYKNYVKETRILDLLEPGSFNPLITLSACVQAKTFIGTNAKLSLWAAIFRSFVLSRNSYLPNELKSMNSSELLIDWY